MNIDCYCETGAENTVYSATLGFKIGLGSIVILLFLSSSLVVREVSAYSPQVLYSTWSRQTPTIDGNMGKDEWFDAGGYPLSFLNVYPQNGKTYYVSVLLKNDNSFLYVGADSQDTSSAAGKAGFDIFLDIGHDGLQAWQDFGFSCVSGSEPRRYQYDGTAFTAPGAGSVEPPIQIACVFGQSDRDPGFPAHWMYEFAIPLSGTMGINSSPGANLGVVFRLWEEDDSTPTSQASSNWPQGSDADTANTYTTMMLASGASSSTNNAEMMSTTEVVISQTTVQQILFNFSLFDVSIFGVGVSIISIAILALHRRMKK